jgi:predicted nucleic acid-binding protein
VIGKAFSKQDIENCLVVDELDFVDKATVTLCQENALILLTNDKDFRDVDLDILTGNPKILH